jgi:hypothetical protein
MVTIFARATNGKPFVNLMVLPPTYLSMEASRTDLSTPGWPPEMILVIT